MTDPDRIMTHRESVKAARCTLERLEGLRTYCRGLVLSSHLDDELAAVHGHVLELYRHLLAHLPPAPDPPA